MVIRNKRQTLFWVINDHETYTHISFSIHNYKSQLMDMGAAQSKCNLHETLATLRGSPPPKVVQGENRDFSENSSTALGMRHRNQRYCNRRTFSSHAYYWRDMSDMDFTAQSREISNPDKINYNPHAITYTLHQLLQPIAPRGTSCPTRSKGQQEQCKHRLAWKHKQNEVWGNKLASQQWGIHKRKANVNEDISIGTET